MIKFEEIVLINYFKYSVPVDANLNDLMQAFTSPSKNMHCNYQNLETVGDSILKFMTTVYLYTWDRNERYLTDYRTQLINNIYLA